MNQAKTIIGLTGNIATGKSVIRRFLANSGAFELDADQIAHRMLYKDGSAYQSVISAFGKIILDQDSEISRKKLGNIVFNDPIKLALLESLIHPEVTKSIKNYLKLSSANLAVIEAIKLLESNLKGLCDVIWVSHASIQSQLNRLMQIRHMPEMEARVRINSQPPQSKKLAAADQIINTETSLKKIWLQVQTTLNDTIQVKLSPSLEVAASKANQVIWHVSDLPLDQLESFWIENSGEDIDSLYQHLGMYMVIPIKKFGILNALIFWDNWNFTGTLQDIVQNEHEILSETDLLKAFTSHGLLQQCEILLISKLMLSKFKFDPASFEYNQYTLNDLAFTSWREAGNRLLNNKSTKLWMKVLSPRE